MRKLASYLAASAILCFSIFFACKKSDGPGGGTSFDPGVTVSVTISGRVTDLNKVPVSNAVVTIGTSTTTTDVDGRFRISNAQVSKNAGFVKINKTGFFTGSRTFLASTTAVNYVEVQLIPKTASGSFAASSGGDINPAGGGKVSFTANSIINETTGAGYSGNVTVSAFFLNPSDANFNQYMPGDLRGINASNSETGLQSFGMMAVELNGSAGEKLQLASGKTATITFPIPAALQGSAPATIPLWYFDETSGMWKEQGTATKTGSNYVGTVSHFSYWNCDASIPLITLEASFKDQNGQPLAHTMVSFTRPAGDTRFGYTDSSGNLRAVLPANEVLVMKVYDRCGGVLLTQNMGPYSSNTNAGVITVTVSAPNAVIISGTAITCNGTAVLNGYVQVHIENRYYNAPINNGSFTITINRCSSTATVAQLTAVDIAASQQGNPVNVTVTTGTTNAGQLSACGISTVQYINLNLNGTNYAWLPPADSLICYVGSQGTNNGTTVNGYSVGNPNTTASSSINFSFNGNSTGTFPLTFLNFRVGNPAKSYHMSGTINTVVTEYGAPGQFVTGTFSGTVVQDSTTNTFPVSCNYRVRRMN